MGEEEEEELEEVESNENISQQELLAREFETWQKSYYDDVHNYFAMGNEQRGYVAFESWEKRFQKYLEENLPEKLEEYKKTTSGSPKIKTMGSSPLWTFQNWKGEKIAAFLEQCIDEARKGHLDDYYPKSRSENVNLLVNKNFAPRIFISHSSLDSNLAELLVELLRSALNIPSREIRCTSLDGYRLPGGADIDNQLKDEILQSTTLIGLRTYP